nr:hypothetical protein [Ruegeria profundi]
MQLRHNISSLQVHVALQHVQRSVAADLLYFDQRKAALDKSADCFVAQIVKAYIIDTCALPQASEALTNAVAAEWQNAVIGAQQLAQRL